jgi:hypothetical protein
MKYTKLIKPTYITVLIGFAIWNHNIRESGQNDLGTRFPKANSYRKEMKETIAQYKEGGNTYFFRDRSELFEDQEQIGLIMYHME